MRIRLFLSKSHRKIFLIVSACYLTFYSTAILVAHYKYGPDAEGISILTAILSLPASMLLSQLSIHVLDYLIPSITASIIIAHALCGMINTYVIVLIGALASSRQLTKDKMKLNN